LLSSIRPAEQSDQLFSDADGVLLCIPNRGRCPQSLRKHAMQRDTHVTEQEAPEVERRNRR
jgi:hypothetical protein